MSYWKHCLASLLPLLPQMPVLWCLLASPSFGCGSPFVAQSGGDMGKFASIKPNFLMRVPLKNPGVGATDETRVPLPAELASSNVMVEAEAEGITRTQVGPRLYCLAGIANASSSSLLRLCCVCSQTVFSNNLRVTITSAYGFLKVTDAKTGKPLPKVYVKVYYRRSRTDKGSFYKDGYTDLRGRFDYTSLNTDELNSTEKFALLVMSNTHGAVVRETEPPAQ